MYDPRLNHVERGLQPARLIPGVTQEEVAMRSRTAFWYLVGTSSSFCQRCAYAQAPTPAKAAADHEERCDRCANS